MEFCSQCVALFCLILRRAPFSRSRWRVSSLLCPFVRIHIHGCITVISVHCKPWNLDWLASIFAEQKAWFSTSSTLSCTFTFFKCISCQISVICVPDLQSCLNVLLNASSDLPKPGRSRSLGLGYNLSYKFFREFNLMRSICMLRKQTKKRRNDIIEIALAPLLKNSPTITSVWRYALEHLCWEKAHYPAILWIDSRINPLMLFE